jgi:hypothetical protein
VPVVLIKLSESENFVLPRPRSGMAAFLAVPAQAGPSGITRAIGARPSADLPCAAAKQPHAADARTGWAGLLPLGQATTALPANALPANALPTNYMTRILASREGALGPHPAREREPV